MERLTIRERLLVRRAMQIASEDGSIYSSSETDIARTKIDAEIEEIKRKLNAS